MKNLINKFLKPFNAEIHGKGYLQALAKGEFKKDEFIFQKDYFNNKKVEIIFDIGANRGDTISKYLDLFPNAIIHAFEPFPETFKILRKRFDGNKRVIFNEIGISNHCEISEMYVNKNVDTNSHYRPIKTGLSSDKNATNISKIKIKNTTIDEYCSKNNISKINILKMDIQGGELNALIGGKELLSCQNAELIFTESYFIQQYQDQPLFFAIGAFLFSHNYNLQDIYSPIYGKGSIAWCDSIFLPKSL